MTDEEHQAAPIPTGPRGRPRGSNYAGVDARLHHLMRQLIISGEVPSIAKAAEKVVHLAYGGGTRDSKAKRLARSYPR